MRVKRDAPEALVQRQEKNRVAFQGECGAYSEIAARAFFGSKIELLPSETFDLVFEKVEAKAADFGVIPIENSLAGSIHQNYDLLLKHRLRIAGELNLRISHNLIADSSSSLSHIRRIFSHPQALMQCQNNIAKFKGVEIIPTYDTAGSVKKIKEEKILDGAAIASELAFYGVERTNTAVETSSAHLFGGIGLMYERWTPPELQQGRTLLLIAWDPGDLAGDNIDSHFERLGSIEDGVLMRGGQVVRHYRRRSPQKGKRRGEHPSIPDGHEVRQARGCLRLKDIHRIWSVWWRRPGGVAGARCGGA
jgi:hypothetical protein